MGKIERFIQELRRRCHYLHDRKSFVELIMLPVLEYIQHDASGITSLSDVKGFNPNSIHYGYSAEFLLKLMKVDVGSFEPYKKHFKNGPRDGLSVLSLGDTYEDFLKTSLGKELFSPVGFKNCMQAMFFDSVGQAIGIYAFDSKRDQDFTAADKKLLKSIASSVFSAYRKYDWLVRANYFDISSIDEFMYGVVVTDNKGRVVRMNDSAAHILGPVQSNKKLELPDCFREILNTHRKFLQQDSLFSFRNIDFVTPFGKTIILSFDKARADFFQASDEGFVLFVSPKKKDVTLLRALSPREREVLGYMVKGLLDKEIADKLFVVEKTANAHVANIIRKFGVSNRTEVAAIAIKLGLT